jgi:hypothetical protein
MPDHPEVTKCPDFVVTRARSATVRNRLAVPKKFAHIRRKLAIDMATDETTAGCAEANALEIT